MSAWWIAAVVGGQVVTIAVLDWRWARHHRVIDARIAWWDRHNPESLRGRGPDYWRNPYRSRDWGGIDVHCP